MIRPQWAVAFMFSVHMFPNLGMKDRVDQIVCDLLLFYSFSTSLSHPFKESQDHIVHYPGNLLFVLFSSFEVL